MDYQAKIDSETWKFIEETATYYPPDTIEMSLSEQREIYDQMCRAFFQGYPEAVAAQTSKIGHIPIRIYEKAASEVTVVYFHGGGFVVGGLQSHDDVCAEICDQTGFRVVAVDYRMAPEHKHPAMFDDSFAATKHVLAHYPDRVLLCGDSAGGNLAAAVSHAMRTETDRITGQVLIYPGLGGDINTGSYVEHAQAPMLRREELEFYRDIRLVGDEPVGDPTYAPLHDASFNDLPPTAVFSAECDPLCDDGRDYRDAIKAAGGKAVWFKETGLVHGYLRARITVGRARNSFARIIAALNDFGAGAWPYD